MKCRYTISLTYVLKAKDHLDDPIVLCMIVMLIVHSAYHYSTFAFGLLDTNQVVLVYIIGYVCTQFQSIWENCNLFTKLLYYYIVDT
jgi:hypothetical protein